MNNVSLVGRLTKDPELRFTTSGKGVATFTLAVNKPFAKDEADFINIVTWDKVAENCANYLAKGRLVAVQGRIQTRTYENKEGRTIYITEVVSSQVQFLEWGDKNQNNDKAPNNKENKSKDQDIDTSDIDLDEFNAIDEEDDIPF